MWVLNLHLMGPSIAFSVSLHEHAATLGAKRLNSFTGSTLASTWTWPGCCTVSKINTHVCLYLGLSILKTA